MQRKQIDAILATLRRIWDPPRRLSIWRAHFFQLITMRNLARLLLPIILSLLGGFARDAAGGNTVAVNPTPYSVNENAGQIGVMSNSPGILAIKISSRSNLQ